MITGDLNIFDPNAPGAVLADVDRELADARSSRNIGVDVRYVGTRHLQGWVDYNYNEANIIENGFLDEFRKAQANLQANIAAGRGNTFAYTGAARHRRRCRSTSPT